MEQKKIGGGNPNPVGGETSHAGQEKTREREMKGRKIPVMKNGGPISFRRQRERAPKEKKESSRGRTAKSEEEWGERLPSQGEGTVGAGGGGKRGDAVKARKEEEF